MEIPVLKDVILIGGGHAHVHTLKMFGMNPIPGVRLTLVSRDIYTPYSGMLPGFIAGHYTWEECHLDLIKICSFANARFVHAEANGIDIQHRLIQCNDNRPPFAYDILSLDIGIVPKHLPQGSTLNHENIIPVKPIDQFSYKWNILKKRILSNLDRNKNHNIRIAIIGGGAGGVELCFSIHEALTKHLLAHNIDITRIKIIIINRNNVLLPSHNKGIQKLVKDLINKKDIELHLEVEVIGVESRNETNPDAYNKLLLSNGMKIDFDEAFLCTQACPQSWLADTSLQLTEEGFISVESTLESVNSPGVFACGDVCHMAEHPRPKAGVFAVRAGPILTENIRRKLFGEPLHNWTPQDQFLGIIGTGEGSAIASKGPMALHGSYIWKLKQHIDRQWMAGYQQLPPKNGNMNMNNGDNGNSGKISENSGKISENSKFIELFAKEKQMTSNQLLNEYNM
eukprot:gene10067-20981_t